MEPWQKNLQESITSLEALAPRFSIDAEKLRPVTERFPFRITAYYLSLIQRQGDPVYLQSIPDLREIEEDALSEDPLCEEDLSPVPGLIHRYPDRVVWLVSTQCATFCRFCMRKRQFRSGTCGNPASIEAGIDYIRKTTAIRDVVLSGGDPFSLPDEHLEDLLWRVRAVSHVEIIRIHTRIPVTLPERVTPRLADTLKRFHPLYVITHFNHSFEITEESSEGCLRLADAGIPLGNQTVLLKGVNDDLMTMRGLMKKLLAIRVRPYYLHQADLVRGTGHFRTSLECGLEIMRGLRGHISGLAVPSFMVDLPGGKGKVPLLPEHVIRKGEKLFLRNYMGEWVEYQDKEKV